jgi:hypothetical protein
VLYASLLQVYTKESFAIRILLADLLTPLEVALTNVWTPVFDDGIVSRTLISNWSPPLTLDIGNHFPPAGSVDLGYLCSVACESLSHVNVRELMSNLTIC